MFPRRSRSWWSATVSAWRKSGQDFRTYALANHCQPDSLRIWASKLDAQARAAVASRRRPAKAEPARLVRVELTDQMVSVPRIVVPPPPGLSVIAVVGAAKLHITIGTDPSYIGALVAAIAQAGGPC